MTDIHAQRILILDFGSQYTQLIARRVREIGVYCELWAHDVAEADIRAFNPNGIILSGGPETVTAADTPRAASVVFELGVPVLGICYGMQTMAQQLGGKVESSELREFGYAEVSTVNGATLFDGLDDHDGAHKLDVWMSHGDKVTELPQGFHLAAFTHSCPIAAMENTHKRFYGVQFHPEVTHTKQGGEILSALSAKFAAAMRCGRPAISSTT